MPLVPETTTAAAPRPYRPVDWEGMKRGQRSRPIEWLAERTIFLVSLSAILMIFLIFVFVIIFVEVVLIGSVVGALNLVHVTLGAFRIADVRPTLIVAILRDVDKHAAPDTKAFVVRYLGHRSSPG